MIMICKSCQNTFEASKEDTEKFPFMLRQLCTETCDLMYPFAHQFPAGGDIGRTQNSTPPPDKYPVLLYRVYLYDGDYDDGGAYWGVGGGPLYCAEAINSPGRLFLRAKDRENAERITLDRWPGVKILGPAAKENLKRAELAAFIQGYIDALLVTSFDDGVSLNQSYNREHLSPDARMEIVTDCRKFFDGAYDALAKASDDFGQHGCDFALTRNRSGLGYDGRGCGDLGVALSAAARDYPETDLYVGDDGELYVA